jgi:hypothetical protein
MIATDGSGRHAIAAQERSGRVAWGIELQRALAMGRLEFDFLRHPMANGA